MRERLYMMSRPFPTPFGFFNVKGGAKDFHPFTNMSTEWSPFLPSGHSYNCMDLDASTSFYLFLAKDIECMVGTVLDL